MGAPLPRIILKNNTGAHMGAPLPRIIQWFKTMTTNEYIRYRKSEGFRTGHPLWEHEIHE